MQSKREKAINSRASTIIVSTARMDLPPGAGPTGPFGRVLQFILFIVLRKLTRHIAWSCFVNRDKNELEAG